jgi:argininosuccinate lyase
MEGHIPLSGRVRATPDEILNREILEPQFNYELTHLLPFYLLLEKVGATESCRLGVMSPDEARSILSALDQIGTESLQANIAHNLSDISFAIERAVTNIVHDPAPAWHVDKSRNDFQACAQRMLARQRILANVPLLTRLSEALTTLAERTRHLPMPGYTHYQAAQIISPGFYLAAINEAVLSALRRLLLAYDDINHCPLGAGAMAGLALPWDRQRMADQLGFDAPVRSALSSVAERDWTLKISCEYAVLGTALSRFCTDLSLWGSNEYGFIDLPDALVGISSAMPQKRNFTILERIRGETAHLTALHLDFMLGQRNTPYTNLVEVSKEAGRYLIPLFEHADRIMTLLSVVVERLAFNPQHMRSACEREYYGGFALANALTLQDHIPYRTAQIVVGEFIRTAVADYVPPARLSVIELGTIVARHGYVLGMTQDQLRSLFDVTANLEGKQTSGSTHPTHVANVLAEQRQELATLGQVWAARERRVDTALCSLDQQLALL